MENSEIVHCDTCLENWEIDYIDENPDEFIQTNGYNVIITECPFCRNLGIEEY